jgi:hypothetical protein
MTKGAVQVVGPDNTFLRAHQELLVLLLSHLSLCFRSDSTEEKHLKKNDNYNAHYFGRARRLPWLLEIDQFNFNICNGTKINSQFEMVH